MAERKFGRNYRLDVQTQDGTILTIRPPFTVQFDITRNTLTSANVCSIRVYNLNANNRSRVRKNITDYGDLRTIEFHAGYGNNLSLCFSGSITQAWSVREGVDFITQIECFDGGFAFVNAKSNHAFPADTEYRTVVETLVQDLASTGVTQGAIGDVPDRLSRGNSYSGNTCDLLQELTGGRFYIDQGKAYVLADNECVGGSVNLINAQSGLLGTPVREQTIINFDMLFEPQLVLGQQVRLESTTTDDQSINGVYKVISVKHRGIISESVAGEAITQVGLLQPLGIQELTAVGFGPNAPGVRSS